MIASKGGEEVETRIESKALKEFIEAAETIVNPELNKWSRGARWRGSSVPMGRRRSSPPPVWSP